MTSSTDTTSRRQRLVAEYLLLDLYDELRSVAGYDYGRGQRTGELGRRRRLLESRGIEPGVLEELESVEPSELADAFARVGRPRLERARRQPRGDGTPPTVRTWERVARIVAARSTADARLESVSS